MRAGMLAFCLAVVVFSRLSALPPVSVPAVVMLLVILLAALLGVGCWQPRQAGRARTYGRAAAILLISFLLGLGWSLLHALRHQERLLPHQLQGVDFWVTGRISSLPALQPEGGRMQQFELQVEDTCFRLHPADCEWLPTSGSSTLDPSARPSGAAVAYRAPAMQGARIVLNEYAGLPLWPGERWRFRVRLNRPHGYANPGGYDYEAALFQRGVVARGYVRGTTFNKRLARAGPGMQSMRAALRQRLLQARGWRGQPLHHVGPLRALILGDRDGISDEQWALLTRTGTNHLLVISGLHVGFVAMTAYALVVLLSRLYAPLLKRVPAQKLGALAAITAAAAYSMLAGFSMPTQRALIMVSVLMAGRLLQRPFLPSYSFLLAATLVLLLDPAGVTQAGFWLSFTAVAALLFALTGYRHCHGQRRPQTHTQAHIQARTHAQSPAQPQTVITASGASVSALWRRWLKPQAVVTVALLLPLLLWTGQVSPLSPVVNIVAIPMVSLVIVPLALVGAALLVPLPGIAGAVLALADSGLGVLFAGLGISADLPVAQWSAPAPDITTILLAMAGVMLWLSPLALNISRPGGVLPMCLLLPLLWPELPPRPAWGQARLQFLDVGQGLAVVVHTHSHDLLFDTGPRLGPGFDTGQAVIVPYLRQQGIQTLHRLVVSHAHEDHSGGADSVMAAIDVREYLAGPSVSPPSVLTGQPGRCQAGERWRWDGVEFAFLHPGTQSYADENNNACVLMISAGGQRALLTGDIEARAEADLLARYPGAEALRADILQAPHHGSATSSSPAFIRAVRPQLTVIPAGYRNRFAHPSAQVVARLRAAGSRVCETFRTGAIQVELGGAGGAVVSSVHRQHYRRFWHNIPTGDYGKVATLSAGGDICGRNRNGRWLVDAADYSVFDSGDCDCH